MVAVKFDGSSTSSRKTVWKPGRVNVMSYVPGRRSVIRYRPSESEVVVRTRSIRTGLLASTVTPGRTSPD